MENILIIQDLSVTFGNGKNVLDKVHLVLERGKCLGLVGESGSGKSLTALTIMRLLPQAANIDKQTKVLFNGQNILNYKLRQMRQIRGRRVAMVFQEALTALNPTITVGRQIDEVLQAHFKLNYQKRREKIGRLLLEVGIDDPKRVAESYPHQLSGGQRQRAMIAIALSGEPELLIADEPTTSLDVILQATILKLLKSIQQTRNMSLLFITHDLSVVERIADNVAVMQRGKIIETATVKQFFAAPQHPYSQQLFATLPQKKELLQPGLTQEAKKIVAVNNLKIYFPICKGLFKRTIGYIKAVDGINLNLITGKTLALVGESGSGKTTAGLGILQLEKNTAGSVYFKNNALSRLSTRKLRKLRRYMQIIFQDPYSSLDPRMKIIDIISEGLNAQGILKNKKQRQQRAAALLNQVGLKSNHLYRYPHEFSGGQRQRICIARALALQPKILILDEPTSALDATVQKQVLTLLRKLQDELNLSYLLITHNFAVVRCLADEVAVMYQGKIVEHGAMEQILTNPQHVYTQRLLSVA